MQSVQMNLKLPRELFDSASSFVRQYGYRNVQDLVYDAVREKIFEKKRAFDEDFSQEEVEAVEKLLAYSIRENKLASERELRAALRK